MGLWPEFAWGHFNLGLAHDRAGRKAEAVAAYSAALERSSGFPDASLNRGLVRLERKEFAAALADLTQAASAKPEDAAIRVACGIALEQLGNASEADEAFARALTLPATSESLRARVLIEYASAVIRRRPEAAREAFETVLRLHPRNPDAFYGLSVLAAEAGDLEGAIGSLDQCLAAAPERKDAVYARAILMARTGQFAEAIPAIDRCLASDPKDGAGLYAGACIAALATKKWSGTADAEKWSERALDLLRRASVRGQSRERAANDPDLASIHSRPEYAEILAGWK